MEILHYAILSMAFLLFISLHLSRSGTGSKKLLPPSPAALPIIGHLHLLKPPRYLSLAALAARYGPVISLRLGSRQALIISSPSALEEVLIHKDPIFANHPMVHSSILACGENSLFFAPYGPHWRNLRRLTTAELLSTSRLNQLAAVRSEELLCIVRSMFHGAAAGGLGGVELNTQIFEMACNAMLRMVVGKRYYGEDVPERDVEVAKQFREIYGEGMELLFASNPRDFFPALGWMDLMGVERRIEKQRVKMDRFLAKLLEEQQRKRRIEWEEASGEENAADGRRTPINAMLSLQENEPEGSKLILCILSAGVTNSPETAEAAMRFLLCHPEIMKKARSEIEEANLEPGRILEESDLPKLTYLHCIVKETMRLAPSKRGFPPSMPSEDCTIQGYHVPRGTMVFINEWGIQRDPELWDDPLAFKPERFVEDGGRGNGLRFIPFGAGRRGCPGENLGLLMVTYALGVLIQCFEWDPMTEHEVDLSTVLGLTLPKGQPMAARYRISESMVDALRNI